MHFFKKIKILRKKKFKNPTYLSSPNCLLSSIPYQYNPFSQPKSSYGAKKSKNVKKRHFTPIFAPKVPHIMFFRKNVTRVFALSQKVSGGLAKFQRDLTYSFQELDFFCKKRIKGKCSFEPTGPPSPSPSPSPAFITYVIEANRVSCWFHKCNPVSTMLRSRKTKIPFY